MFPIAAADICWSLERDKKLSIVLQQEFLTFFQRCTPGAYSAHDVYPRQKIYPRLKTTALICSVGCSTSSSSEMKVTCMFADHVQSAPTFLTKWCLFSKNIRVPPEMISRTPGGTRTPGLKTTVLEKLSWLFCWLWALPLLWKERVFWITLAMCLFYWHSTYVCMSSSHV